MTNTWVAVWISQKVTFQIKNPQDDDAIYKIIDEKDELVTILSTTDSQTLVAVIGAVGARLRDDAWLF